MHTYKVLSFEDAVGQRDSFSEMGLSFLTVAYLRKKGLAFCKPNDQESLIPALKGAGWEKGMFVVPFSSELCFSVTLKRDGFFQISLVRLKEDERFWVGRHFIFRSL